MEPLRITITDKLSPFTEVLNKDNFVPVRHRNIRALAIETDKVIQGFPPSLLNEVYVTYQCIYDIRGNIFLEGQRLIQWDMVHWVYIVSSSKTRKNLTNEIKISELFQLAKAKIKKWFL